MVKYRLSVAEIKVVLKQQVRGGATLGQLSSHYPLENCPSCAFCQKNTRGIVRLKDGKSDFGSICEDCFNRISLEPNTAAE
jgi:hypothetical protein